MALFKWTERLATGVARFDEQHQHLIALVNDLHDAMMQAKGAAVLGSTLTSLIEYTKTHFADEEALMTQASYPGLEGHRAEHVALTNEVLAFQKRFEEGSGIITIELLGFLRDWLTKHISTTDRAYGPFLKGR